MTLNMCENITWVPEDLQNTQVTIEMINEFESAMDRG